MSTVDRAMRRGDTGDWNLTPAPPIWVRCFRAYECRVLLCPEAEDGGFSAFALDLPGVVSQGETREEAMANIKEAFVGVAEHQLQSTGRIHWGVADIETQAGCETRCLLVNVQG